MNSRECSERNFSSAATGSPRAQRGARPANRRILGAVLGALALGLAACGPDYDHIEISSVKSPPGAEVRSSRIAVPEGMIVVSHVVPWNDDNETMSAHVRARDPEVIEVTPVVNDRNYAFIGKKAGHTQVEFIADDKVVLIVEADVSAQPSAE